MKFKENVLGFFKKIQVVKGKLNRDYIKGLIAEIREKARFYINKYKQKIEDIIAFAQSDVKERNRIMLLSISGLVFIGYLMLCLLIDKNIFDIFPPIPAIDQSKKISIYIPSDGCTEIITEESKIYTGLEDEKLIHRLFYIVAAGSSKENTRFNVPAELTIKKIWIIESEDGSGKTCIIDLMPVMIEKDINVVKGSEQMFRDALEKTIVANVPGIKKVILLEKGVPNKKLWEI